MNINPVILHVLPPSGDSKSHKRRLEIKTKVSLKTFLLPQDFFVVVSIKSSESVKPFISESLQFNGGGKRVSREGANHCYYSHLKVYEELINTT